MIINSTTKRVLTRHEQYYRSEWQHAIGLMFSKKVKPIVFVFSHPIREILHMIFVFHTIDVLFLNAQKKVVELKENFKPFTFYGNTHPAKYIIELPKGTIKKSKTRVGHTFKFTLL